MYWKQEICVSGRIWVAFGKSQFVTGWTTGSEHLQNRRSIQVLSTKNGPKKDKWWTYYRVMGTQGSLVHMGEFPQNYRRAQITEKANRYMTKVSEHTLHHRPLRVPTMTHPPLKAPTTGMQTWELAWSDDSHFRLHRVGGWVHVVVWLHT